MPTDTQAAGTQRRSATVRLWQLISPALPVGAYSWSGGLEQAVTAGWVFDLGTAESWILGQMEHTVAALDAPVLARMLEAFRADDVAAVAYWQGFILAARETAELLACERQQGAALERLLDDLEVPCPGSIPRRETSTFVGQFARACAHWEVSPQETVAGYLWSWLENQVAAAVKLIPLGQTTAQRMLLAGGARIPGITDMALALEDGDIGAIAPSVAIASARHETQYTRLFRS